MSRAIIERLDVPGPRYTSYPTVPVWSEQFGADAHAAALARAGEDAGRPLSLYVHIPFCREMCSYCGCNVIVTRDKGRGDRYVRMLGREAALQAAHLGARRTVSRLHLGGGTPTFLDEVQLEQLWRALADVFSFVPGERAVEVNPAVTHPSQLERLRAVGFDRVSMGVQDFDPEVQAAIGRIQSREETRLLMEAARRLGYRSVNLDLIYGLPRQEEARFRHTVREVAALAPERVALFSFAYVPSLKPHQRRLPAAELPRGEAKLRLFLAAREELEAAGYRAVGMDHFARPGDELAEAAAQGVLGRDFQGYTVERAPHTIGLGVSAISDLGDAYAQNVKSIAAWTRAIESGRLATERGVLLDEDDRLRRGVIRELMCNFTVTVDPKRFAGELAALTPLERDGLVTREGGRVVVTPLGRLFVRNVAMVFDRHLRRGGTFSRAV